MLKRGLSLCQRLVRNLILGTPKTNRRKPKARRTSHKRCTQHSRRHTRRNHLWHVEALEQRLLLAAGVKHISTTIDNFGGDPTSVVESILPAGSLTHESTVVFRNENSGDVESTTDTKGTSSWDFVADTPHGRYDSAANTSVTAFQSLYGGGMGFETEFFFGYARHTSNVSAG